MMWKDFFYFSRTERQGIVILAVLIVLVYIASWFIPEREMPPIGDNEQFEKEYAEFMASIKEQKQSSLSKHQSYNIREHSITLAAFNPNTADSATFISLGLPPWMARNILRYRAKGGMFKKPEDFRKIYGLTEEQYTTLQPYITLPATTTKQDTIHLFTRKEVQDTLQIYKYPIGTVVNLNQADTTELKKIPGIGSAIARMIIGYRKKLGGYYSVEQLEDINLSVDKLRSWFLVDVSQIQRINLNKASIERLKAHPYINFYQAKAIIEYRRKRGILKDLQPFKLYEEFSEEDFEKLTHYICFE